MASLIPFNRNNSIGNRSFGNMLDDFFNDNWFSTRNLSGDSFKIDIQEGEKDYTVEAEMPGVKKEEIGLSLNDGRLTINLQHSEEANEEDKERRYVHRERRYTSMSRSVYLADASSTGITAKLEDGILKIVIPKEEKSQISSNITIE